MMINLKACFSTFAGPTKGFRLARLESQCCLVPSLDV